MQESEFNPGVYFRLLASVVVADGEINAAEVQKLATLIDSGGGDGTIARPLCDEALEERTTPLWFLDEVEVSSGFAKLALRDGLLLACSDGHPTASEKQLLSEAAQRMGLDQVERAMTTLPNRTQVEADGVSTDLVDSMRRATYSTNDFPGFQGDVYFRIMAAVATIDGEPEASEVKKLEAMLAFGGVDPSLAQGLCADSLSHNDDPLWFLEDGLEYHPTFAELCLRDASVMAYANLDVVQAEVTLLQQISRKLGRPGEALPTVHDPMVDAGRTVSSDTSQERRRKIDIALAAVSSTIVGGGAYVLMGGKAATFVSGITAGLAMGMGGWMIPIILLLTAGTASAILHIVIMLDDDS